MENVSRERCNNYQYLRHFLGSFCVTIDIILYSVVTHFRGKMAPKPALSKDMRRDTFCYVN